MRPQKQTKQQQVALLNDQLLSCVLTAGTNVKKYTHLAEKNEYQLDLIEVSKFCFDLVQSRTMTLDVNAKIVCGMCYIFLCNVQQLRTRLLILDQKQFKGRQIGYKEKNVVRQFEVECRPDKDGRSKVPINLDEFLNMDIDFVAEGTEKDVIDALLASQKSTMVQNVEDITLRDLPTIAGHVEDYQTVENDFGEAGSNELLDFFNDSNRENVTEATSLMNSELRVTRDELMDIDPPVEPALHTLNSNENINMLPLEDTMEPVPMDTMQPVPMEIFTEDDKNALKSLYSHASYDRSNGIENNIEETPTNLANEGNLILEVKNENEMANGRPPRRSRLIIDVYKQLSIDCLTRRISKCSKTSVTKEQLRQEAREMLVEQKLNNLFSEPLRPWRHSFLFQRNLAVPQKRKASFCEFDIIKKKSTKSNKHDVCNEQHVVVQPSATIQPGETLAPVIPGELTGITGTIGAVEPVRYSEPMNDDTPTNMLSFLNRFTGDPSQWEYLKRTEEPHAQKTKDKKDEGVVTSYALRVVLRSLFEEAACESIPFEKIQAKMGSRQIAASLFAKLLELSATKTIRIVTNQVGLPVEVQQFHNWTHL